jgi:Domain of unknown function (DUF4352)
MLQIRIGSRLLIVALLLLIAAGCAAPWTPPTPADILAKPSHSSMKDGHFKLSGHLTSGAYATDLTGDGVMILQPNYASSMHLQGSIGALPFALQTIDINGKSYSRVGSDKWTEANAQSEPGNPNGASGAKLIGEDGLPVGKSWHVRATGPSGQQFDVWVRESDGYLVKYSGGTDSGSITLEFDRYNIAPTVAAPAASEVKPPAKQVSGAPGQASQLNGVTVTVVSADLNARSTNQFIQPKAGNRFVVVQVLYENSGSDKVSYNPFDWTLSDSSGFSYTETYSGVDQALHSGDLDTGEKARGYISYEVPQSATGLSLKYKHDDDSATVTLGQ